MTPKWYVPRRTILRGLGTAVALPFLEAMVVPKRARALDPKTGARRFVGIWGLPSGCVGKDDRIQKCMVSPWTPDAEGPLAAPDAAGFLDPFFGKGTALGANVKGLGFRDVHTKLSVLTGLSDMSACHVFNAVLLAPRKVACPTLGENFWDNVDAGCSGAPQANIGGATADQIAAQYFYDKRYTPVHSLVMGAATGKPSSIRDTYGTYISWKSATEHAAKDTDPGAAFDKLFGGGADPREDQAATMLRKLNRTSVLDVVKSQADAIKGRIGADDQIKLGQYLDSIRDIEGQIARGEESSLSCSAAPVRPEKGNNAYLRYLDLRIKVMVDLMVKAFECDRTRVSTLMFCNGNGESQWPFLGLTYLDHHSASHYTRPTTGTVEQAKNLVNTFTKFSLQMLAYLMAELDRRVDDPSDGSTILDNSVLFMSGDHGDSDAHSVASANVLLGGRGGRTPSGEWAVRAGRHVRCSPPWNYCYGAYYSDACATSGATAAMWPMTEAIRFAGERSTKDLLWGMLKAIGIPDEIITGGKPTFGYATAPLDLTFPGKA